MKLFGESVKSTFTNSPQNILQVEEFSEIFFNVYEIRLKGEKYIAEKVSEYMGKPVVSVPVTMNGNTLNYPFVLSKGAYELTFNENNFEISLDQDVNILLEDSQESKEDTIISSGGDISVDDFVKPDDTNDVLIQIEQAKNDARVYLEDLSKRRLALENAKTVERKKILSKTLSDARSGLVEEFIESTDRVKVELFEYSEKIVKELKQSVDENIQKIAQSLKQEQKQDFADSTKSLDLKLENAVGELYEKTLTPKIDKELSNISSDIVRKVDSIDENLRKKLEDKVDVELFENVSKSVSVLETSNVELHDIVVKSVRKTLGRVGEVQKNVKTLEESVNSKLDKLTDDVSNFQMLEEKVNSFYQNQQPIVIKKEGEPDYIIEKASILPVQNFDLEKEFKKLKKEYEDRYSDDIVKVKKMVMYGGGGGSVARQYQDGGQMNGGLTIVGDISATGKIYGTGMGGGGTSLSAATYYPSATASGYFTTVNIAGSAFAMPLFLV